VRYEVKQSGVGSGMCVYLEHDLDKIFILMFLIEREHVFL
jgi:hypothetical protein